MKFSSEVRHPGEQLHSPVMLFVPWKQTIFGYPSCFKSPMMCNRATAGTIVRTRPFRSTPTSLIGTQMMMPRLLMASHFIRVFCPGERFSKIAVLAMMRAAPMSQHYEVEPTGSERKTGVHRFNLTRGIAGRRGAGKCRQPQLAVPRACRIPRPVRRR